MAEAWTGPRLAKLAATVIIAAIGGGLGALAGLPAAWLSGAMIATTTASLAGFDTRLPLRLVDAVFLVIGLTLGAGISPEVVAGVAAWPISLAGLFLSVGACIYGVRAFLAHVAGWDRDTAFFSAVPGALSYVLAVASLTHADMRKVAVSQSVRIFLLVALLPSVITALEPVRAAPSAAIVAAPGEIVMLFAVGLAAALLFRSIKAPAPLLIGGLAGSAVLHGTGWVVGTLPTPLVVAAFVLLGALVGSRFSGTSLRFLRAVLLASIGAFVVAAIIAGVIALAVAWLAGIPVDQVIVAFAPGGLDAMTALSLALGMDSAFVAAHQLARFAGIALVLPFLARKALERGRLKNPS